MINTVRQLFEIQYQIYILYVETTSKSFRFFGRKRQRDSHTAM